LATSLAAAIKKNLGITAKLKKGHGGIFEVAIDGKVVYTNRNVCGSLPTEAEIVKKTEEFSKTGLVLDDDQTLDRAGT
jgi:predicted Rdx family selenoprotein